MPDIPRKILSDWAATKPTVQALFVFGSYARGEATSDSDLDLAFEFISVDEQFAELIVSAAAWKKELSNLTGLVVKDLYLSTDPAAQSLKVQVFKR